MADLQRICIDDFCANVGGGGGGGSLPTGAILLNRNTVSVDIDAGTSSSFEAYIEEMDPVAGMVPSIDESVLYDVTMLVGTISTEYKAIGHHTIQRDLMNNELVENILLPMVGFTASGTTSLFYYGMKRTYESGAIGEWGIYSYNPHQA